MPKRRRNTFVVISLVVLLVVTIGLFVGFLSIHSAVREQFGPPAPTLNLVQRILYPLELYIQRTDLTSSQAFTEGEQVFVIEPAESVSMVCLRLENTGLIQDAELLRTYLVYTGQDRQLQAGRFTLSMGMAPVELAAELLDATPQEAVVSILPGWRIEEVAANVAGSGLSIPLEEFIDAAYHPTVQLITVLPVESVMSLEGFLYPEIYIFARDATLDEVLLAMLSEFSGSIDPTLMDGFTRQGVTPYEAIILASIIEKEAVVDEEKPMIASVFHNRLAAGMRLETDPTVQYALGYQESAGTWWKAPLSIADLAVDSSYNTYQVAGLPPTPICNPALDSLRAVAFPAETPYYYFRAACDGSGRHSFAITYEEHLSNACE